MAVQPQEPELSDPSVGISGESHDDGTNMTLPLKLARKWSQVARSSFTSFDKDTHADSDRSSFAKERRKVRPAAMILAQ